MQWIADAADRAGVVLSAPLSHRVISRWWPQAERSDHGAFTRRGIRAIHFYNRGHDGEWIDLAYHSPRDVPARIDRERVEELGRLLVALTAKPVPAHDGDGFWLPFVANTVIARWIVIALELALLLAVIAILVVAKGGLISRLTRDTPRARGAGLLVGIACYALAVGAAVAVEQLLPYHQSWIHAPLRILIAEALVLGGALGLATRIVARYSPWVGSQRYLVLATLTLATIGLAWLVLGAAELAWIWLAPALVIALAPRMRAAAPLAIPITAIPLILALRPMQLREAAFNGFLPALPLAIWLGFLAIPPVATTIWWLRQRSRFGPLGTLVLGVGCGLAVIVGLVVAVTYDSPCSAAKFDQFRLACERV
jgi:hypothetical protein